jgi:DNA-binding transcriptional ArsR family regulator
MGRLRTTLVVAALWWSAPATIALGAQAPGQAIFEYGLGSVASGRIQGSCEAAAIDATSSAGRVLALEGSSASLRVYETVVNTTLVAPESGHPVILGSEASQSATPPREVELPARVTWSSAGRAVLVEPSAVSTSPDGPFRAAFDARGVRADPALSEFPTVRFWDARGGPPIWSLAGLPGARAVRLDGDGLDVTGHVALYLEDALVVGGPATGPALTTREETRPGLVERTDIYRHGVLEVADARLRLAASPLACRALGADIDGAYSAYEATGTVEGGSNAFRFERRELRLEGTFRLDEAPQGDEARPLVAARGEGDFRAFSLDFAPAPGFAAAARAQATVAGLAVAAVVLALWKLAPLLFTRLKPDALLDRDGRRRVHDAVEANPGISLADLAVAAGMSESNARYHLSVLRRHDRLRSYKVQGTWRFVLMAVDRTQAMQRSLVEGDAPVRRLLELLSAGPLPAKALVEVLQREAGLSRSGGWKVVDRAYAARLVVKEKQGKMVILRSA